MSSLLQNLYAGDQWLEAVLFVLVIVAGLAVIRFVFRVLSRLLRTGCLLVFGFGVLLLILRYFA